MAQALKSTKDFEFFGGATLARLDGLRRAQSSRAHAEVTENSKAAVILSRCAIFRPATAEFRLRDTLIIVCRRARVACF
jgi:hypothetical protein